MKAHTQDKARKHPCGKERPVRIISEREVERFIRFEVALIRWKRRKLRLGVERCCAWVGLTAKCWRNVEHGRNQPAERTRVLMMVAVNLSVADVAAALERRKIAHLRRITGAEKLFQ